MNINMEFLKKLNKKIVANSIIESVVALTIISICLYLAMVIFSNVLTPKRSPKFYNSQNKLNSLFYELQLNNDSITNELENISIDNEPLNENLYKLKIKYKDSSQIEFERSFYLLSDEQ